MALDGRDHGSPRISRSSFHGSDLAAASITDSSPAKGAAEQQPTTAAGLAETGRKKSDEELAAEHQRDVLGFNLLRPSGMQDSRTHHPSPTETHDVDVAVASQPQMVRENLFYLVKK